MEMSHRIHFLYQILLKMQIFGENAKKITFLIKNFCDKLKNNNFELKMLKLLENHVETRQECFSQIFNLGNIFENFDQKRQKT